MQKLSCKKNRQLRARWKMRDAERAKARMPPVVTYTLNQFAWCSFSLPFSYFLIYCDLLMLIDDRLTEDPRMHRASYAFAEFHSLAAFFAHRKARDSARPFKRRCNARLRGASMPAVPIWWICVATSRGCGQDKDLAELRAKKAQEPAAGFPLFRQYQCCVPGSVLMPQDAQDVVLPNQQRFNDLPHTYSPFLIPKFTTCKFTSCFLESQDTKWAVWAFYMKIFCPWQERKHEEEIMQKREANHVLWVDGAKLKLNWFPAGVL